MPIVLLFLLTLFLRSSEGGVDRLQAGQQASDVFTEIADGLSSADISRFSSRFASQVHMTLRGGESGLFSANQAYTLLQGYLKEKAPSQCTFAPASDTAAAPYATGGIQLTSRGRREKAQVYVALARSHDRWVITHFTIY
jgi:hypothetical protein